MGFFDGILKIAAPIVGGLLGGPAGVSLGIGATAGSAVGSALGNAVSNAFVSDPSGGSEDFSANPTTEFSLDAFGSSLGSSLSGATGGAISQGVASAVNAREASQAATEQNEIRMNFEREMAGRKEGFEREGQARAMGFSADQIRQQQQFNLSEAEASRMFQERMSNTAFRRAASDLAAAGLNPMLAYRSQATTPVGATATSGAGSVGGFSGFSGSASSSLAGPRMAALNSAASLAKVAAEVDHIRAETDVSRSQALINAVQVPRIQQETLTSSFSAAHLNQQTRNLAAELERVLPARVAEMAASTMRQVAQGELSVVQLDHELSKIGLTKAEIEYVKTHAQLLRLEIPGFAARARMFERTGGDIIPYLPFIGSTVGSAAGLRNMMR